MLQYIGRKKAVLNINRPNRKEKTVANQPFVSLQRKIIDFLAEDSEVIILASSTDYGKTPGAINELLLLYIIPNSPKALEHIPAWIQNTLHGIQPSEFEGPDIVASQVRAYRYSFDEVIGVIKKKTTTIVEGDVEAIDKEALVRLGIQHEPFTTTHESVTQDVYQRRTRLYVFATKKDALKIFNEMQDVFPDWSHARHSYFDPFKYDA
jgi:hypothetical protein